jgi:formate--tetrahydrofolate ligase
VLETLDRDDADFRPLYGTHRPIRDKIDAIVRRVYGGDGADYTAEAARAIDWLESVGLGETPVCMAKTQFSLTDDPTRLGVPRDFRVTITDVYGAAGAGFVVAKAGDIMTMPGLPKSPAAERIGRDAEGRTVGLS